MIETNSNKEINFRNKLITLCSIIFIVIGIVILVKSGYNYFVEFKEKKEKEKLISELYEIENSDLRDENKFESIDDFMLYSYDMGTDLNLLSQSELNDIINKYQKVSLSDEEIDEKYKARIDELKNKVFEYINSNYKKQFTYKQEGSSSVFGTIKKYDFDIKESQIVDVKCGMDLLGDDITQVFVKVILTGDVIYNYKEYRTYIGADNYTFDAPITYKARIDVGEIYNVDQGTFTDCGYTYFYIDDKNEYNHIHSEKDPTGSNEIFEDYNCKAMLSENGEYVYLVKYDKIYKNFKCKYVEEKLSY